MEDTIYKKGQYTATIGVRPADGGVFRGVVALTKGERKDAEETVHEVPATSLSEEEALDEARALAHRILGDIEV
jgi:hypothetical protein